MSMCLSMICGNRPEIAGRLMGEDNISLRARSSRRGTERRAARRRRLSSLSALTLIATASAAVFEPTAAIASPFGSTCGTSTYDCVSKANNTDHAVRFQALSDPDDYWNGIPGAATAANHAITQLNRTNLYVHRNESDSLPDVWFHDFDYGASGWLGLTQCPANNTGTGGSHPNRWCRGQNAILNSWYYWNTTYLDTDFAKRTVACHELGHTVGLQHNTDRNSCMHTLPRDATGSILSDHDIAHVNAAYGSGG